MFLAQRRRFRLSGSPLWLPPRIFQRKQRVPSNGEMRCSLRDFVVGSVVDLELAIQTSAQEARRLLVQTETQDAFLVVRGT